MLERNLGVRLFQRSTRKLTLTTPGNAFSSPSKTISKAFSRQFYTSRRIVVSRPAQ